MCQSQILCPPSAPTQSHGFALKEGGAGPTVPTCPHTKFALRNTVVLCRRGGGACLSPSCDAKPRFSVGAGEGQAIWTYKMDFDTNGTREAFVCGNLNHLTRLRVRDGSEPKIERSGPKFSTNKYKVSPKQIRNAKIAQTQPISSLFGGIGII